jgi:hypothetical protein
LNRDKPLRDTPSLNQSGQDRKAERLAREAAALRANLQKRKAQARAKADPRAPRTQDE